MNLGKQLKDNISKQLSSNTNLTSQPGGSFEIAKSIGEFNSEIQDESVIRRPKKKSNVKNLVTKKKMDKPIGKLPMMLPIMGEEEVDEKWSEKYKKSIDCNNPKGFSQRAHCQGRKKKDETKEATGAASAGSYSMPLFGKPIKKTKKPTNENFGVGSYRTPSAWAKSTNKKNWRGKSKTQIPGGKFVQVKKKCKKFPYCNQGDINALKIFENETVKKIIKKISQERNINENVIKNIILYEIYLNKKQIQ